MGVKFSPLISTYYNGRKSIYMVVAAEQLYRSNIHHEDNTHIIRNALVLRNPHKLPTLNAETMERKQQSQSIEEFASEFGMCGFLHGRV